MAEQKENRFSGMTPEEIKLEAKRQIVRSAFLALAALCLVFRWGDGGWLDLSGLLAMLLAGGAGLCLVGMLLGWLAARILRRRRK